MESFNNLVSSMKYIKNIEYTVYVSMNNIYIYVHTKILRWVNQGHIKYRHSNDSNFRRATLRYILKVLLRFRRNVVFAE